MSEPGGAGTRSDPRVDGSRAAEFRAAAIELAKDALSGLSEGEIAVSGATQSMAPMLRGGETLRFKRPRSTPRFGDVVLFMEKPGPVVHRVVGRRRDGALRTKGDARAAADVRPVAADDVLGVVVGFADASGTTCELTGAGARVYAVGAALLSQAGRAVHLGASVADALLRRTLPGYGDRRLFRAPLEALQRGAQVLLYTVLFRPLHRRGPAAGKEGTTR